MAKEIKQMKIKKIDTMINTILLWPVSIMIILVPLIVRLNVSIPNEKVQEVFRRSEFIDFFSQGKAVVLIIISIVMLTMLFFLFDRNKLKKDKCIIFYLICTGIFALFTIISALFSEYKDVALWGIPDRAEGVVITICYVFIMVYVLYVFNVVEHYKYILIPLAIVTIIVTIMGLSQWVGKDLMLNTEAGLNLIIPQKYEYLRASVETRMPSKTAYGTFSNPNYIGSFVALVFPIFMTLVIFLKNWKKQIIFLMLTLSSIFLLAASGSRAGIIGCATALIVAIVIFIRLIIEKWFVTIPVILVALVALFGVNQASGGKLAVQIKRLPADITAVVAPPEEKIDYKDLLPVRAITNEEGQVVIRTQKNILTVSLVEGQLSFYDEQNQKVEYKETENDYISEDERFSKIEFSKISTDEGDLGGINLQIEGINLVPIRIHPIQGVYLIDGYTQRKFDIIEAPAIGFEGKERVGSGRGYIWSRSIPLLLDSLLIGNGPDTFPLYFPQNDYLAKYYALLYKPTMVVDKPHNMYMQIGINNSGVALGSFLLVVMGYMIQSVKVYIWKKNYTLQEIAGIAITLGISGYLAAGVFNDSVVGIAFIFWILLGMGISINYLISHQSRTAIEDKGFNLSKN